MYYLLSIYLTINRYMFRAGLLLIIRSSTYRSWYVSCVYVGWLLAGWGWMLAANQHKRLIDTNCCIYRQVSPDDEQLACSKHVEVNFLNKMKANSASCWFL